MSCPHCPHCNPDLARVAALEPDGLEATVMQLRAHCIQSGIPVLPFATVREEDAAKLMNLRPKTLKHRRALDDPSLPSFEIRSGRALYALASIAAWMGRS